MRTYMDYLEEAFLIQSGWGPHTSYADIIRSSRNILDFSVPVGASLYLTSQPAPLAVTTYTLSSRGSVTGSLSYLYSSLPVNVVPTRKAPLDLLVQHYSHPLEWHSNNSAARQSKESPSVVEPASKKSRNSLLYGRMFLPGQALEAMTIHQIRPGSAQLVTKWVCDPRVGKGIVFTSTYQSVSRGSSKEFIYSSHENLLGVRCLSTVAQWSDTSFQSRLALGMEAFYAASRKSPGASIGARYSTYSRYTGTPLTLTLVSNPLMGNLSVAYALKPTTYAALSSRFDFNFYSYLSDLTVGCELWRTEPISANAQADNGSGESRLMSVFKASTSLATQSARLLWETSYRGFLVSLGGGFCYSDRRSPILCGIEFSYASSDLEDDTESSCRGKVII